jgi:predicted HTH domain antitoxin
MDITVSVPEQYLIDHDPGELAKQITLYAAILMFRSGELSAGAACEFAAVDRLTFALECQRRGIALIDYPVEDLRAELDAAIETA